MSLKRTVAPAPLFQSGQEMLQAPSDAALDGHAAQAAAVAHGGPSGVDRLGGPGLFLGRDAGTCRAPLHGPVGTDPVDFEDVAVALRIEQHPVDRVGPLGRVAPAPAVAERERQLFRLRDHGEGLGERVIRLAGRKAGHRAGIVHDLVGVAEDVPPLVGRPTELGEISAGKIRVDDRLRRQDERRGAHHEYAGEQGSGGRSPHDYLVNFLNGALTAQAAQRHPAALKRDHLAARTSAALGVPKAVSRPTPRASADAGVLVARRRERSHRPGGQRASPAWKAGCGRSEQRTYLRTPNADPSIDVQPFGVAKKCGPDGRRYRPSARVRRAAFCWIGSRIKLGRSAVEAAGGTPA